MRFFENKLADFVPGSRVEIDKRKWKEICLDLAKSINDKMPPVFDSCNGGVYIGCAGVAYMYYYIAGVEELAPERPELLTRAQNYSDVALSYTLSRNNRDPPGSFLLGNAGVYAVTSLVYDALGQTAEVSHELIKKYLALSAVCQPLDALKGGSDELFVGRAGYLCGALLLNRKFGQVIDTDAITKICSSIIQSGRDYAQKNKSPCPLMYAYYKSEYLGAAHGLSAILQMLLNFPEFYQSDASIEHDIRASVDYMLENLDPSGNLPPSVAELVGTSRQRRADSDELVHWCHGGPGIIYLFAKAFLTWKDPKYLDACLRCGELTWQKGLLRKGAGICHGVAGNGYVFLLLYRLTSDEKHLHRAVQFAEFLLSEEFQREACTPDTPYSLFEGLAGTACYIADIIQPQKAEFPFFNVF